MKYGFIGAGNMVSAIVKGMLKSQKDFQPQDIIVTSKTVTSAQQLSNDCGGKLCVCNNSQEVIDVSDMLILGIKPKVMEGILPSLKESIGNKKMVVISLAAGKDLKFLEKNLPEKMSIIRVMPNINAKIGSSTTGFCANEWVSEEEKNRVIELFSTIGTVSEISEEHFAIFSAIGGASVAFAYLYMDALAHAALKAGMPKKQALNIVAQTVMGSGKMILESGEAPWPLIDQVCSPGGTTIEGITSLQADGFESILVRGLDAVIAKDIKLGKK